MITKWYKIYVDYIDKWIKNLKEKFLKEETDKDKTLKLINTIDPVLFAHYNRQENANEIVTCHYGNIDTLVAKLDEVVKILHGDKIVYKTWDISSPSNVDVPTFFLTDKGIYLNEEIYVKKFKELSMKYFDLYFECLNHTTGNKGHNARVLTHFTRSLESTIESFINLQKLQTSF